MIQKHVWVTGRVQGVGFRASTAAAARAYAGLRGFVRNLSDGRVEAVFLGDADAVSKMVEWCRRGPPSSQVTHLEVKDESVDANLAPFELRRDG